MEIEACMHNEGRTYMRVLCEMNNNLSVNNKIVIFTMRK